MAQKAAKTLATRNSARLFQTHLISAVLHTFFLLALWFSNRYSLKRYLILGILPNLALEAILDYIGRPRYHADGSLRTAGADLGATGLTEYMWDVVYWTWICMCTVLILGNRGWWFTMVIPLYSVYAVYTTFMGVKKGFAGMAGGGGAEGEEGSAEAKSKRELKKEKRGPRYKTR
ncbi:uncharacterized protein PFLUO_LOCUS9452 [Penicillium psychrofluorescens]|uniref:uncharacterized protein n=1 Tax=Penicillium psychrofluorescens TaxID=3158075 RepID=UPI003CCCBBE6